MVLLKLGQLTISKVTFERVVTKDFQLSDGLTIPANTTIGIPAHAVSMDPKFLDEPHEYKGFRFDELSKENTKLNNTADDEKKPSVAYAASHPSSMAFGYGRHACPGRNFASAEIKAIMVHLLMNYEFKFPKGKPQRPPSLVVETQNLPNPSGRIMFKRRK